MDITGFVVAQRNKALLLGDYGSYRKQLSRRLLVVRKKLNYSTKGRKYSAKPPVTVEDIASNHEFVHLLLLSSERAWAFAMHMKSTRSADSNTQGVSGSTKQHIVSRLHKASGYASHLLNLLQDKAKTGATGQTELEARAYQQSLQGAIEFEKQNWDSCLQHYSETRLAYTALTPSAGAKQGDIFQDLLSATIDPSIRYAAYQLKLPRTISIEAVVLRYVQKDDNEYIEEIQKLNPAILQEPGQGIKKDAADDSTDVPKTITWRTRTVNLEDAATAQALASVYKAEENLISFLSFSVEQGDSDPKRKAAAYDDVLIHSQDAVDATRTAIEELLAEGVPQGDPRMQSLQITRTSVNYNLVGWRIGRNRILCGERDGAIFDTEKMRKSKKPRKNGKPQTVEDESSRWKLARLREKVVLYDTTLQSLDSVKDLPGVAADQVFVKELDAIRAYFAALRCLAIARSHDLLDKPKNALALLSRALDLSSQAKKASSAPPQNTTKPPKLEVTQEQANSLHDLLGRLVLQHRALVELHNLKSVALTRSVVKPAPMIERLDEYPPEGVDLTNLVTYPPKLQPIPVKPIFLDLAWNYIDYPGRVSKPYEKEAPVTGGGSEKQEEKKEGKRGWFSFGR